MATVQPQQTEEIYYPAEDGEPMGETGIHVRAILTLYATLRDVFRDTDAYIAADMFWYWEKGNPFVRRAPDVMFIPGVGRHERRSFFTWRENGAVPSVIFEMSSQNTWRQDVNEKLPLYAGLGVKECFLFDPEDIYLQPCLQGFRLQDNEYVPIEADSEGRLFSVELGLIVGPEGHMIRLFDGETGQPILTGEEQTEQARDQAEQARNQAEQAHNQAQQARDQVEQARNQAEQAEKSAAKAQSDYESAKSEMERERQRSKALEAEIAKLREQLNSQSNSDQEEKR